MTTLMGLLKAGDAVLCLDDVYGGSGRLLAQVAVNWGIQTAFVDMTRPEALQSALSGPPEGRDRIRMVWVETPSNPTLRLVDLRQLIGAVRAHDPQIIIVVDNTFASPVLQRPIAEHGADVVLHSVTKYLGGHSDVLMGALVVGSEALQERLAFLQNALGAVPSPFDCFLALRGIKTLHLRVARQSESALRIAQALARNGHVEHVNYPGLPNHPQHDLAVRQMRGGFGGVVSFRVRGTLEQAVRVCRGVRIFALAESLGGVESLIELPSVMTHASVPVDRRELLGITDTLVRISVGIEDPQDLIDDLVNAINSAYL
jgi:cystathionine gamma-lyase